MSFIKKLKSLVYNFRKWKYNFVLKNRIINFYNQNENDITDLDFKNALKYYKHNDISVFPYSFKEEYSKTDLIINNDNGFNYYLLNNHKLYFKQNWSELSCKSYIKSLLIEQDSRSPHCYCNENFSIQNDETLLDIGAAEGNFSLLSINLAKEIVVFEYNNDWFKTLTKTFKAFSHVKIIHKKVDSLTSQNTIALDDIPELFSKKLFIKMDVEGGERSIFKGMEKLLSSNPNIRLAVCTYHGYNDANEFEKYFKEKGFQTEFSTGYMLYYFAKDLKPPFLRKGVLRVWK
ncbi:MAG: FkbM family methyltransferase [Bacteroidia bacterium]